MLSGKDKVYHIAACFLITIFTFVALVAALEIYKKFRRRFLDDAVDAETPSTVLPNLDDPNNSVYAGKCKFCRLLPMKFIVVACVSGFISMVIGAIKEIGDIYNLWYLCNAVNPDGSIVGCQSSWYDIFADLIGVVLGEVFIFLGLWIWLN